MQLTERKSNRLEYVDVMRGIAITLVVVGHLIQFNGISTDNPVFEFIYSFHMPLFFAISGYITQKVTKICSWQKYVLFLKKKTMAIALPFLVWTLFVGNYILRDHWRVVSLDQMLQSLLHPGLWFLKSLFFILIVFGLFDLIQNKINAKGTIIRLLSSCFVSLVLLVAFYSLGIEQQNIFMYSFFFFGGGNCVQI